MSCTARLMRQATPCSKPDTNPDHYLDHYQLLLHMRPHQRCQQQPGTHKIRPHVSVVLNPTIFSMPHASSTATIMVFSPFSNSARRSAVIFLSSSVGSPVLTKVGRLRSSFVSPLSKRRLTSPVSPSAVKHWSSVRFTNGIPMLWDAGQRSSYFLDVKMSNATMWHFACPCFPVFEEVTSATFPC